MRNISYVYLVISSKFEFCFEPLIINAKTNLFFTYFCLACYHDHVIFENGILRALINIFEMMDILHARIRNKEAEHNALNLKSKSV